jgi:hypothetical protein
MTTSTSLFDLPVIGQKEDEKEVKSSFDLPVVGAATPEKASTKSSFDLPIAATPSDAEAEKAASKFKLTPVSQAQEPAPKFKGLGTARKPLAGTPVQPTTEDVVKRPERATLFARPEEKVTLKQQAKPSPEAFKEVYRVETEESIPVDKIYDRKNPYFNTIKDYMESRGGESGKQKKDESDKDYVNRFFSHMRMVENNYMLNMRPELEYLTNTTVENAKKAGEAFKIWDKVPAFFMEGGQEGVKPLAEAVFAQASDPLSYLGYGVSKGVVLGRVAMGRKVMQEAVKNRVQQQATTTAAKQVYKPAAVAGVAGEFVSGTVMGSGTQQLDIEAGLRDINAPEAGKVARIETTSSGRNVSIIGDDGEVYHKFIPRYDELLVKEGQEINKGDLLNIPKVDPRVSAAMGVFSAVLSTPEAIAGARVGVDPMVKKYEQRVKERKAILSQKEKEQLDKEAKVVEDLFSNDELTQYDVFEGRKFLDQLSAPTELTEAQIRKDINKRALDVAKYVMLADPTFRPKPNQKISDAVRDLFMSTNEIDDATLEAALNRANMSVREFAQASRTTVHDAAVILQQASELSKLFRESSRLFDDETKALLDAKFQKDADTGPFMALYNGVRSMDRNMRAVVVSGIGTTVRNVFGTTGALTLDAASNLLESTLYNTGNVFRLAVTGNYEKGDIRKGLNNIVKDTFGTFHYLTNVGLSSKMADDLLQFNPKLKDSFLSALQETGNENLTKAARFVNTLNVAQDALFRKAIFNASVSKQLRDVGIDVIDVIAEGKVIPKDILKKASDDALKMTFSYTPKAGGKGFEGIAESAGAWFVKGVEMAPVLATSLMPFPRFVTNAIAWQYRNNVISQPVAGVAQLATAVAKASNDPAKAHALARDGLERISKGVVGGGILAWAYNYRSNNPDVKATEIKTDEGETVDLASLAPVPAAFLAVADVVHKYNNDELWKVKWSDVTKTLTGLESAGVRNTFFENLPDMLQASKDIMEEGAVSTKEVKKFIKAAGQSFGDYFTMLLQPASPLIAAMASFDREEQVARDPNVVEGQGVDLFTDAALKRVQNKIPVWRQSLPEAVPYLRPDFVHGAPEAEQIVRPTQFFDMLAGTKFTPQANKLEKEVARVGMEPYEFFKPSGNKEFDRAKIVEARQFIKDMVMPRIEAREYTSLSDAEKRKALRNYMSLAINTSRKVLEGKIAGADFNKYSKMEYENLPKLDRIALKSFMEREYDEKSPELSGDYATGMTRFYEMNAKLK